MAAVASREPDGAALGPGAEAADAGRVGVEAARAAAQEVLGFAGVREPDDIHIARIAALAGAGVIYGATGSSDARMVRAGDRAWICVDERSWGTPRGRWSVAHELAHFVLHDASGDAIARVHAGAERTGRGYQLEREADAFAGEVLMPTWLFSRWCFARRPTLADIDALADRFGTSRTATARRYVELSEVACAFVEIRAGRVTRVARSRSFRGKAVQRREVEAASRAAAALRGEAVAEEAVRVTGGAWGSAKLGVEMVEQVVAVPEAGLVLAWLWHEAG
jgi:Zn-dependent peptidase ImmA (M78 family)